MTIDRFTGNVLKIRVKDQEFNVVKHIYSPLILFGRGTHVFIVKDHQGSVYVLKDSWILVEHGLSEIDALQTIKDCLESDKKNKKTKAYRAMCPQFIIGEDLDDSTKDRRGMLANIPPDRKHRRVVTGPVGDSLTSYRSRAEFIKVMLDCAQWLQYLHEKCLIVHGDLSINNIVIYRSPHPQPPKPKPKRESKPKRVSKSKRAAQLKSEDTGDGTVVPATAEGVDEHIPVTGIVIDYDYARKVGTRMDRTSGTLPFMPLMALDKKLQGQYIHEPAHDLESLLQTILAIVCFNDGACGVTRSADDSVPTSRWFNEVDRDQLHKDKTIDLLCYEAEIEPYLTEYWKPFAPFLKRLVNVT
ncbi:hypothetical protein HYPSUDRAFT_119793, partial [Hypholoma sublateritium FD-334 SS-4]